MFGPPHAQLCGDAARKEVCKHIAAFTIKQIEDLRRETGGVFWKGSSLKVVGLREETNTTNLFECAEESEPKLFKELYNWLVQDAIE